ncbi:hypothetical protein HHK36_015445 [Tetracentron sinense]|uniref:NAC domain-containing protein n=1 Tax=Tetracentron sinense TaxID=13715 RepID=A0A834Z775_TETSI|nr:hypothetical protein HHK36_015445 [Tetracentron sinense]
MKAEEIFPEIPIGYKFIPTDQELVWFYLINKIFCRRLPAPVIKDINATEFYSKPPHMLGTYILPRANQGGALGGYATIFHYIWSHPSVTNGGKWTAIPCFAMADEVKGHQSPPHFLDHVDHNRCGVALKIEKNDRKEWFFFIHQSENYHDGWKSIRMVGNEKGFWKYTGEEELIDCNGHIFAFKICLRYYYGMPPKEKRSHWIMKEYRLSKELIIKMNCSKVSTRLIYVPFYTVMIIEFNYINIS